MPLIRHPFRSVRRPVFVVGLVLVFAVAAPAARAQNAPRAIDPGQLEKRFEQRPTPKREVAPLIPALEGQLPPERARAIRFVLSGLVIDGATVFPPSDFAPFYEDRLAREVSLADIYEIAARINRKYAAAGYLLSRVVVPGQEVELGIIHIRVIEGHLANVVFEGRIKGSSRLLETYAKKITESHPLRAEVLERYVLLMNDLPGMSAERRLVPRPDEDGAYDLIITIDQKTEYGFARFDNRGSRSSGPFQFWLGGGMNSALGLWDNTQLRAVTVTQTRELRFADLSHSQIIDDEGTRLSLGLSANSSEPGANLAADRIESRGVFASIGLDHALIRSRRQDLFVGAHLNFLNSHRDEFDSPTIDDKLRVLRLSARLGFLDGLEGRNNVNVYLSRGLGIFGATRQGATLASRAGAPEDFTKLAFDLSRYQPLGPRWGVLAALAGQRSGTKLFSSEQYGLGGEYLGRAFDPSEIAGDDAIAGKIELQWTSAQGGGFIGQHQYYVYYDHGATWLRASSDDFELASAGFGTRLSLKGGYFAALEVAQPLVRAVSALGTKGTDPRLFFVLSANF